MTSLVSITLLLQAALSLLALVQANPSLPQSTRDSAVLVAQNAIAQATSQISTYSYGATIDHNALTTVSSTPTITGTANGLSSVYVDIWMATPSRAVSQAQILGGTAPVTNGRWTFTVSDEYAMYQSVLQKGMYTVHVYTSRGGTLLTSGTLTVQ